MKLRPLANPKEIELAFRTLRSSLTKDMKSFERIIGFPSGNVKGRVFWRPDQQLWIHMSNDVPNNKYWCCFGTADPQKEKSLSIVAEINPPTKGFNRQVAGAFLKGRDGAVYLAHSGRVGGGKPRVGKINFLNFIPGPNLATIEWPDGIETDMILIADVNDPHLPQQIATFIYEVDRFKKSIDLPTRRPSSSLRKRFTPEFEGRRIGYRAKSTIHSICDHGVLVGKLYEIVNSAGVQPYNDQQRDLFIEKEPGKISLLFEVKTSNTSSDIYSGIGQLLINSAFEIKTPKLCLVLPKGLSLSTKKAIRKLDIDLLEYSWPNNRPIFPNARDYIASCTGRRVSKK